MHGEWLVLLEIIDILMVMPVQAGGGRVGRGKSPLRTRQFSGFNRRVAPS